MTRRAERLAWLAVVALFALIAAGAIVWHRPVRPAPVPESRLEIPTAPTTDPASLAISPDGRKLVFVATADGLPRLWLRPLDSVSARPLAGTDLAYCPFWSPDNRSVGFFAEGKLRRIDVETETLQVLANATAGRGGAWNRDGVILFAPQAGPIFRIAAVGGEPSQLTQLDTQRTSHRFPQFLPDGRHFLYYVTGTPQVRGVHVGELGGTETRRLLDADGAGVFAGPGRLLFVRQGTLYAQSLDASRLTLSGSPFPVAVQVVINADFGSAAVSASANGLLVYRAGPSDQRQFVDRSGREIGKVGGPDSDGAASFSISPDGGVFEPSTSPITVVQNWMANQQ